MISQQLKQIEAWLSDLSGQEASLRPNDPFELALNGLPVSVVWIPEMETLMAVAVIDDLTALNPATEMLSRIVRSAMEGNYQWNGTDGGAFGLNDDGLLLLQNRWFLPAPSEREIIEAITRLVLAAEEFKKSHAAFEPASVLPADALRI